MASTLNGLFLSLAWPNFPTRQGNAPGPGETAHAAFTSASANFSGPSFVPIAGSRPAQFNIGDDLNVRITFNHNNSFVMSWVLNGPQQDQDDMLNHEQGHYDITALVGRDFFVDVMLLKSQTFASSRAAGDAVALVQGQSLGVIQRIQRLYDRDVQSEQDANNWRGPNQQVWDRFIQTALTQARSTGTTAPDGTPHRVRLIDVLAQNGKRP
jgi:hypothetical protein